MALARWTSQSSEPTGQPLLHAISLRVQPKSELLSNAAAVPVVSHHARPRCVGLKSGFDRTTVRFVEEIRLSASVPTSTPFDFQYNKSGFSVSSATLLLLTQILVCCIDRLKPHREGDVRGAQPELPHRVGTGISRSAAFRQCKIYCWLQPHN